MSIASYLEAVNKHYQSGHATEHSYRGDFAVLIKELVPNVNITNEPSNVTDCGNPDYVITKKKIPVGFIEAKDVGKNITKDTEQFKRYRKALDNLIITDYIAFRFFQNGELIHEISIGKIDGKKISPLPENFNQFTNLISDFCTFIAQTIKSPKVLAEMMAAKARLLENILESAITSDEKNEANTSLKDQYKTFKNILIHDLTPQGFADIYAQTLAYGMFAARLHDKTLDTFSRQEAAELIPKSNPFLRKLFNHVAGVDIDERIETTVNNLAEVFRATDIENLLKNFGKSTQVHDPIIHFYETFLSEYNPDERRARGVWYTPEPVVGFIVRGVDNILKRYFSIKEGLADTSKITIKLKTDKPDRRTKSKYLEVDKDVHRVQILDPATGTGTFLAEVIKHIYFEKFSTMQGAWSNYVEEHLLPRINGFELLMASYSVAHLKLDMLLRETGCSSSRSQRFNIFLTNSLEKHHPDTGTLFSSWLSSEANEANRVKRDTPVMVMIGNPPYSIISSNLSLDQKSLIDPFRYANGIKVRERGALQLEKNLNDDYVKFIALAKGYIDKTGAGVVGYITNHNYLESRTLRGVRWNLANDFDQIYILNLHGSSQKNRSNSSLELDENVFDIETGVCIAFLIKTQKTPKSGLGKVFYSDIYGNRKYKYEQLTKLSLDQIDFKEVDVREPYYEFVPREKDSKSKDLYLEGFKLDELFPLYSSGVITARDKVTVAFDASSLWERVQNFVKLGVEQIRETYSLGKDSTTWQVELAQKDIITSGPSKEKLVDYNYRLFDTRKTYYTGQVVGFFTNPRKPVMRNFNGNENLGLVCCKQLISEKFTHVFITTEIMDDSYLSNRSRERSYCFPLYKFNKADEVDLFEESKEINFNNAIVDEFSKRIQLPFNANKDKDTFTEFDIFDYIYAVLHSQTYRDEYMEFLQKDFPRIPYPTCSEKFFEFVNLGAMLRKVHTLQDINLIDLVTNYPIDGDNVVTRKIGEADWEVYDQEKKLVRIWINESQFFENISESIWKFQIGCYMPAQKWLKDRVGRILNFSDILHYQKLIYSLSETERIMKEIESIK